MSEINIFPVKYIFLDVVGFTYKRSVEAQSDIIEALNNLIKLSIKDSLIPPENIIFLPTGDGICIALVNIDSLNNIGTAYDAHLRIALNLLKRLEGHNNTITDEQRRFQIRIGINENVDNVVIDINGNRNVAGDGVNMSERVMSLADGNQILVSSSVFATLNVREKYFQSSFKKLPSAKIKHGIEITTYQVIIPNHSELNTEIPQRFKSPEKVEIRLTKIAAYYFAHAIKNEQFFLSKLDSAAVEYSGVPLLYLLANDSLEKSESNLIDTFEPEAKSFGKTFEEQFAHFDSLKFWILTILKDSIAQRYLSDYYSFFETDRFNLRNRLFINLAGKEKLKNEWKEIWEEFALESDSNSSV